MKEPKRIHIKGGVVTGFHDEVSFDGLEVSYIEKTRVSRIVPVAIIKRIVFYLIRSVVSDSSRIAGWTRRWEGPWQVHIGNDRTGVNRHGPFMDRSEAIVYEKRVIHEMGISK